MPDRPPDSKQRLQKALSGVSTAAVRAKVADELVRYSQAPLPPSPLPPADLLKSVQEQEAARALGAVRTSSIEDLQQAGKIASDFMAGMDAISDVLMLLVLKFGRASTFIVAVFGAILVGVVLLAANLCLLWNVNASQVSLQTEQGKIQLQQVQILERQKVTQLVAGEAKQKAEAAEAKVTQVQQSSPAVTVDEKGRPQLVVQVPDPEGGSQPSTQVIKLPRATSP